MREGVKLFWGYASLTTTALLRRRCSLLLLALVVALVLPYPFAALFMVYGFHHQVREAQFFWYGLNRDAERHGNRLTFWQWLLVILPLAIFFWPREGTPLHHHYGSFLIAYSLFNGVVHNGLMPQLVLKKELEEERVTEGLERWLLTYPALFLLVTGIVDAILKALWEASGQGVPGQWKTTPNRWIVASLGFNGFAHALTWNTTITVKARARRNNPLDSGRARVVRWGSTLAFSLYWLYGAMRTLLDGPQAFFPVAELFLHISVIHQWSELVFYWSWYRAPRAGEAVEPQALAA